MLRMLCAAAAALGFAGLAHAQSEPAQEEAVFAFVYFTHFDCPAQEAGTPGSTPQLAIDPEDFQEAYASSMRDEYGDSEEPATLSAFHCKYVRISGVMSWMHYYHYRARLYESPAHLYFGDDVNYLIENFSDTTLRRGDLMQRRVTLVGRFYDLCAAAARAEQTAGETWILFGPCHYGANNGMMLENVVIEQVHDERPQYLLGERNRAVFGQLPRVTGGEREALVSLVRVWAAQLQRDPGAFEEAGAVDEDSYLRHVARDPRFARLNVRRARVDVFLRGFYGDDDVVGCICLVGGDCRDAWPVASGDSERFLGDAACTTLEKDRQTGVWRWED